MSHRKTFGANLRAFRNAKGLTQEQLARKCKVTSDYISMLEHGRANVGLDNLVKFAKGLRVTVSELIKGVE
jgi:transcriptional regulator with XRE-family HTH domain